MQRAVMPMPGTDRAPEDGLGGQFGTTVYTCQWPCRLRPEVYTSRAPLCGEMSSLTSAFCRVATK
jgi:hypothetical protein